MILTPDGVVAAPVTMPAPDTVASEVLLLLHTPPAGEPLSEMVAPAQTLSGPEIVPADIAGNTVTT